MLKLLINDMGFKVDSVATVSNCTPAHLAVLYENEETFKTLLTFNPRLDISATGNKPTSNTSLEGDVGQFVEQMQKDSFKRILEIHILKNQVKDLNQEKEKLEAEKNENKNQLEKMKIVREDLGISSEFLNSLAEKKLELKTAENLSETLADYQVTVLNIKMANLRQLVGFKTEEEIKILKEEIVEMKKTKIFIDFDNCAICLEMPKERVNINSCQRCGGLFCEPCVKNPGGGNFKVEKCPLCQISINKKPFIRNLFAEKCIASQASKE